ncbi:hypothetical protein [Actinoplanes sp. NPDC051494]|uniref:hypothetical protein n=1 Tax=Actinoplanes sp. NPDC051494 TaxID=3363907 RepID=UPI0037B31A98
METLTAARRKVRTAIQPRARRTWTKITVGMVRFGTDKNVAAAEYFAVLDGHSLNVQLILPDLEGAVPASAQLAFTHGRAEHRVPARLGQDYLGRWTAEALALFGERPGGLPLTPGTWDLALLVTTESGDQRRLTVRRTEPEQIRKASVTVAAPPDADTGMRFRPAVGAFGVCHIDVQAAQPRAEMVRFVVDLGKAEVIGRFVAVPATAGAVAEFHCRDAGTVHQSAVTVEGEIFRFGVPLAAMASDPGGKQVWDIRIRVGGNRIRVGRFLHDLSDIRTVLKTYERRLLMPGGAVVHLRPYYTTAGSFALTCTSTEPGAPE